MSILLNAKTRLVVQGLTGKYGSYHTEQMIAYGTQVVAGVTPKKGGKTYLDVPIFNTVLEAVEKENANTSIIFVPAPYAADAVSEAACAGIKLIICITEGIPTQDVIRMKQHVANQRAKLIGPNCPGIITPNQTKVGIMPGNIFIPGNVGVISRSGTLTYEAVYQLTKLDIGQSTAVGIGGDPIIGLNFIDIITKFEKDHDTEIIVMIGEIGGSDEEETAKYIKENVSKPVFAFIAGSTAPKGRRMGHAGAIISGSEGSAEHKKNTLEENGIRVIDNPAHIGRIVKKEIF